MNNHINYVEFAAADLAATEQFFKQVFAWQFEHYGPDYIAFSNSGLDGGFFRSELAGNTVNGSALVVLYSDELEQTMLNVKQAGGTISKDIFSFPGGRRFHFIEPSGNELAVWTAS
ncbi:VOC family protein [Pseudoalteromonas caenipelagi]|nr:VOC family protein [Pseudoalteromonas caenipelagi]